MKWQIIASGLLYILFVSGRAVAAPDAVDVPVLAGEWIKIADSAPDVSPYNNPPRHNACDFSIWQAADGTWQMVACIRETSHPGRTRLFHRWESPALFAPDWAPKGIFATSDPQIGHVEGRMQAPHCFKHNGKYYFFYNSNGAHCMISDDGKTFRHHKDVRGSYTFFKMGRDVQLFKDGERWIAYYCARGMTARTAPALEGPWSEQEIDIAVTGNPESPFVLRHDDKYYLWQQMFVYVSSDPLKFPDSPITKMTPGWSHGKYAPEIIESNGQFYVAGYGRGIWLAKMKWEKKAAEEIEQWRATELKAIREHSARSQTKETAK